MSVTTENLQAVFTLNDSAFDRGIDRVLRRLDQLTARSEGIGPSIQKGFESPLVSLTKFAAGLFTIDKALELVKQGLQTVSDFERYNSALSAVSSSNIDFARSQSFLLELSDDLGVSYSALISSYAHLKAATNGTNLEGAETERIFKAIVKAGAALKLTNEQVQGSLRAVTQMLSVGTVQSDELKNELGNHLPGALKLMASALKVSEGELMKMLETGQVMSRDALPKLATELEKTFGSKAQSNVNTMAGGFQRAKDQLALFIAEFAKENKIDSFFANLTNKAADAIKGVRRDMAGSFQNQMGDFMALPDADKQKRLTELANKIGKAQFNLNTLEAAPLTDENLAKETTLTKRLAFMRQLYGQMYLVVSETKKKINAAPTVFDPIKFLDEKKDRQKYLTEKKQGLALVGKELSKAEAAELAKITKQLEDAGARKPKKDDTYFEYAQKQLEKLTKQIESYSSRDIAVPENVIQSWAKWADKVEKGKNAIANLKPLDLGSKLKYITTPIDKVREAIRTSTVPFANTPALGERRNEVLNYGSFGFMQDQAIKISAILQNASIKNLELDPSMVKMLQEYTQLLEKAELSVVRAQNPIAFIQAKVGQIRQIVGTLSMDKLVPSSSKIAELAKYISILRDAEQADRRAMGRASVSAAMSGPRDWANIGAIAKNWKAEAMAAFYEHRDEIIVDAKDMTKKVEETLRSAAPGAAQAMGEFVNGLIQGTANIGDLKGTVLSAVADMLESLAKALAGSAAFMLFIPGMQGQAAAQFAGAAGLYGVASAARASGKKDPIRMAKGGTLTGRTTIEAAEYSGASQRPEWVSPVDVGAKLISDNIMKTLGGSGGGTIELRARGSELYAVVNAFAMRIKALGG
ncbi:tape measure protein [Spirosoma fluminis]